MNGYVSADIESTGLDDEYCKIIQVGFVIDDLVSPIHELPKLELIVRQRDNRYPGEAFAINMNADIFRQISEIERDQKDIVGTRGSILTWCFEDEIKHRMFDFFMFHGLVEREGQSVTFAGKNFGSFDRGFLKKAGAFKHVRAKHRSIDIGNLFWNPMLDGPSVPDSKECLTRAGFGTEVKHTALADALDVVGCIRAKFGIHPQEGLRGGRSDHTLPCIS
jgi:hypothetical protein